MAEILQLFTEQGEPLEQGAERSEVFEKGILHGAAHVWVWRDGANEREILVQKRAATMKSWPNRFDISAAGHIGLGETPVHAAIRETKEEIGLDIKESHLFYGSTYRFKFTLGDNRIENEIQWIYLLKVSPETTFKLEDGEVATLIWKTLDEFNNETTNPVTKQAYVPHEDDYYKHIIHEVKSLS